MITFLTLAASAALAGANPVNPGPYDRIEISVQYGDLDLASEQGRHTLDDRVRDAAATICGEGEHGELAGTPAVYQCRQEIVGRAKHQVGAVVTRARAKSALAAAPSLVAAR